MDDEDVLGVPLKSVVLPVIGDGEPPIPHEPPHPETPEPFPIAIAPLTCGVNVGDYVEHYPKDQEGVDEHAYGEYMDPQMLDAEDDKDPLRQYQQQEPHQINLDLRTKGSKGRMNVRCILVNTEGHPSVVYCPGRSDIEMNKKIRSIFHFYPSLFMSRALDYRSDVWHGRLPKGEYNKIAMTLLGKPVRGPLLIITRGDEGDISSQKYVDTDWSRVANFLSQERGRIQLPRLQQRQPPKQEQQKQHTHIGAPSLNIISNNTSMGSSISITPNPPAEELEKDVSQVCLVKSEETTRAYSGEGAFTYKPNPVYDNMTVSATFVSVTPEKATSKLVRHKEPKQQQQQECYASAQYGNCGKKECSYMHIVRGIAYPIPEKGEVEEEEEKEVPVPPPKRKPRKRRAQPPPPQKRRRSSRIADNEKKKKARH